MKKILSGIFLSLFLLGVLSYSYAFEIRSLYNSVFNTESERIVVSSGDAVVFSFSKQISSIKFNLTSGFTIKTLEGGIWSDIGNTVDQFPPLRGYIVRNFSTHDLVITATYKNITSISQSIFQNTLKAGWNLVGVASKNDINGVISADNGLGASLPYSQILDFTGNGYSSGSFLDKAFTGNTQYYSGEAPLFKVYYSGERSFLKNISNLVSNSGYTITSKTSMTGKNLNEGLAYGLFVNNDTLISGSQKLTSAENTPYYTPPKVGVISDVYVYSGVFVSIDLNNYITLTDRDSIISYSLTGTLAAGLSFNKYGMGVVTGVTSQTGTYTLGLSAIDKDGVSNVSNFNLIVNSPNISSLGTVTSNYLTAANLLASYGIINDNSANPINYNLSFLITRKEIAKVAANIAGLIPNATCFNQFSDVSATTPNTWACGYVEALLNAGLISANATFHPGSNISKAETLKMMLEAAGYTNVYTNAPTWQSEVVAFAVNKGIIPSFIDYNTNATIGWTYMVAQNSKASMNTGVDLLGQLLGSGATSTGSGTPPVVGTITDKVFNTQGFMYNLNFSVTPTDGDPILSYLLTGTLPTGLSFSGVTGRLEGVPTQTGTYILGLSATDKDGISNISNFNLIINATIPPKVGVIADQTYSSGSLVSLYLSTNVTLTDGNGIWSYGLTGTLPIGLSFNTGSALISGTTTQTGTYNLGLFATDIDGVSNISNFNLLINNNLLTGSTATGTGTPPIIGTIIDKIISNAGFFNLDLSTNVTLTNGDPVSSYNLIGNLPIGLTFDTASGVIGGYTTQTGTYSIGFNATDIDGISNTSTFNLIITSPALMGTIPDQTYLSGSIVNLDFSKYVISGYLDPISSYDINIGWIQSTLSGSIQTFSSLGLTFDGNTGILSGKIIGTGSYLISPVVYSTSGSNSSGGFTLTVNQPVVAGTPPTIGTIASQTYLSGATVSLDLSTNVTPTNGDPILSYGITGTLPTGLSFNTGSAMLSGVVTGSGVYNLKLSATDKDGTANAKPLTITVSIPISLGKEISCSKYGSFASNSCTRCFEKSALLQSGAILNNLNYTLTNNNINNNIILYKLEQNNPYMVNLNTGSVLWSQNPVDWVYSNNFNSTYTSTDQGYIINSGNSMNYKSSITGFKLLQNTLSYGSGIGLLVYPYKYHTILSNGSVDINAININKCTYIKSGNIVVAGTPPTIGTIASQTYLSGATVSLDLSTNVTPTNGDPILSYGITGTLPVGLSFNTGSAMLSGVVTGSGVYNLKLSATDKDGTANAKPLTITVNTPVVTSIMRDTQRINDINQFKIALQSYYTKNGFYPSSPNGTSPLSSLSGSISNIPVDPINNSISPEKGGFSYYYYGYNEQIVPQFMTPNPKVKQSWYMILYQLENKNITLEKQSGVRGYGPNLTYLYDYNIDNTNPNTSIITQGVGVPPLPLVLNTILDKTYLSGSTVNIDLGKNILVNGNTPPVYNLTGTLPIGLTFNTASGIINGTTTQVGTYPLGLSVTDSFTGSNISNFNLIINTPVVTTPPSIGTIPDYTFLSGATINSNFNKHVTITDGNPILSYGLTGILPTGLSFNTGSAIISGSTTQTGTYNMGFNATDIDGISNTSNFNILVQ